MKIDFNAAKAQKTERLFPVSDYPFEILSSEEKTSRKGQAMFVIKLAVVNEATEKTRKVVDYVGEWDWKKLEILCESVGLEDKYNAGEVEASDLIGLTGVAHIKHGKDLQDEPQMQVGWYVPNPTGNGFTKASSFPVRGSEAPVATINDDDVPF